MKKLLLSIAAVAACMTTSAQVADFENVTLPADQEYWTGISLGGADYEAVVKMTNGNYQFPMVAYASYGTTYTCGFNVSQSTSSEDGGMGPGEHRSITGKGYDNSAKFITYQEDGWKADPTVSVLDAYGSPTAATVTGCYVTNTPYIKTWVNGTGVGSFGDPAYAAGDWVKLVATGIDSEGNETTTKAELYLLDYRDEANMTYLTDWAWLDLSVLGAVKAVKFSFEVNDAHIKYGMVKTPREFCLDNFGGTAPTAVPQLKAKKAVQSESIYTLDGRQVPQMVKGVNTVVTVYEDGTTDTRKVIR